MRESELLTQFRATVRRKYPGIWIYKIPDTGGTGGKRPFDMIIIHAGKTFVVEGKRKDGDKPTEYQEYNLCLAESNGAHRFTLTPGNRDVLLGLLERQAHGRDSSKNAGIP